jgi:hypothetical protein
MEVEVPARVHVLDFEAPDFTGSKLFAGFQTALLVKALRGHEGTSASPSKARRLS